MTQRQPSNTRYWLLSGGGVLALLAVVGLAVVTGQPGPATAGSAEPPTTRTAAPATTPPKPAGINPGVYLVGVDVQPGTYRTDGAAPRRYVDGYCMWSRHDSVGGGPFDGIIASDGSFDGQLIVTIEPGDKRFMTRGCQPWTRISG